MSGLATLEKDVAEQVAAVSGGRQLVSANAYLGIDALLPALATGADLIITGRVADSSLFLAPAAHAHGWNPDDWPMMAAGALAGVLSDQQAAELVETWEQFPGLPIG